MGQLTLTHGQLIETEQPQQLEDELDEQPQLDEELEEQLDEELDEQFDEELESQERLEYDDLQSDQLEYLLQGIRFMDSRKCKFF